MNDKFTALNEKAYALSAAFGTDVDAALQAMPQHERQLVLLCRLHSMGSCGQIEELVTTGELLLNGPWLLQELEVMTPLFATRVALLVEALVRRGMQLAVEPQVESSQLRTLDRDYCSVSMVIETELLRYFTHLA